MQGPFRNIATSLARGFRERGVRCDILVLHDTEKVREEFPALNIISLKSSRAIFSLRTLVGYLSREKPDVVFSMPWYFNVLAIWARELARVRTKIVMGEHNIVSLEAKIEHSYSPRLRMVPVLMRWFYPYGDGIVGVSRDTLNDLVGELKVTDRLPMRVIPNPADIEFIRQRAAEPFRLPAFQNDTAPLILTAARFAKQKRLDVLLRAVARVREEKPVNLLILGDGPLRPELEALVHELKLEGSVAMPGYDRNPVRYMAACDAFVLASAWEGCPVALQEALVVGAPTIVSDALGGSKELVEHGRSGMVVEQNNVEALAQALLRLVFDTKLKADFREKARVRSEDFRYEVISQSYLEFAESL